ncbi:hypothetical protein P7F88_20430 [Vibrio hannami]|uniref:hypothetical protein n=1 Tax=Vibrio hannami TaxID=2717094 RepID=UPI00241080F3|nr:hypothetical protein [Vibrio hannami]MDG3088309.1 hypothetical protein [Vibrio hannami]
MKVTILQEAEIPDYEVASRVAIFIRKEERMPNEYEVAEMLSGFFPEKSFTQPLDIHEDKDEYLRLTKLAWCYMRSALQS